ncbi:lactonase family protein [Wenyingzhuangia aestuarii]|uniref:lactonase family protein n=1 Tax=Wenyingzhuangia aestuarii TaxID=1647582 RepID=UPI00143AA729|nr:lactonase family protein [Wenyingzhuangia aestuarii]NJB81811.1 6-phosphogluconolactonase [Wenyingzhuangia aestuarii]
MYTKLLSIAIITCLATSCKTNKTITKPASTSFYIGTVTNKGFSTSQGIYQSSISTEGKLSSIELLADTDNPSYLAKTSNQDYLISTNSGGKIGLSSFKIGENQLTAINTSETGKSPCYVSTQNGYVLNANYGDGTIDLHTIDKNGKLSSILDTQKHTYSTPSSHKRQKKAFAHSCYFEPNSNNIIAIDLGANKILFSSINKQTNKFVPNAFNELELPKNSGPRLLSYHPTLPVFYVVNELNATVSVIAKNIQENTYSILETVPTLPAGFDVNTNTAAHIEITKDGKFLYMSNRGHDSISVFSVAQNGTLTFVERVSVQGKHPRNFSLSTDNQFLVVANRDTNNICSFKRDVKSGKLTFVDEIEALRATCILF